MKLTLEYFRRKLRKAFIAKARGCKKATKAVQFSTLHLSYYKKVIKCLADKRFTIKTAIRYGRDSQTYLLFPSNTHIHTYPLFKHDMI